MSETPTLTAERTPTVYFIDDSATMREVIKIAFRKENIHVITCADAASALAQFGETAPDAVITDVIMPDKDGYEVCEFIKQHERFGKTPVLLMSGVVNRTVAEKAMSVRADELIRKPFQPQDLILRVKNLLNPKNVVNQSQAADSSRPATVVKIPSGNPSSNPLTGLFSPGVPAAAGVARPATPAVSVSSAAVPSARSAGTNPAAEIQKLRNELRRLELFVKKLQAELEAEHQYCAALEAHFKAMQESE